MASMETKDTRKDAAMTTQKTLTIRAFPGAVDTRDGYETTIPVQKAGTVGHNYVTYSIVSVLAVVRDRVGMTRTICRVRALGQEVG
jgi:hypothetical protein